MCGQTAHYTTILRDGFAERLYVCTHHLFSGSCFSVEENKGLFVFCHFHVFIVEFNSGLGSNECEIGLVNRTFFYIDRISLIYQLCLLNSRIKGELIETFA